MTVERAPLGSTMTVLRPAPGILAFYDGRVRGVRAFSETPNWIDDGAYELGIASYAIVDGSEALIYDTHVSIAHARAIRTHLEGTGVRRFQVVLSHWHLDHVAGNEVFADCEIIAHRATLEHLVARRAVIEAGTTEEGPPPISPLVLPTRTFDERLTLRVGRMSIEVRHADIHSRDGAVILVGEQGPILAGDTLEDTVTYVAEPDRLAEHLVGLGRLAAIGVRQILPNHGAKEIIATGGYGIGLITATRRYVTRLLESRADERLRRMSLAEFVAPELAEGWITYFEPYEAVHRLNIAAVSACGAPSR